MSRIGKVPIEIPEGVKYEVKGKVIKVTGPKGTLSYKMHDSVRVGEKEGKLEVSRKGDDREHRSLHGLTRALIKNMIIGVSEGYQRDLQVIGTGYSAEVVGQWVKLSVGFSHDILLEIPEGISVEANIIPRREQGPLGVQATIKVIGISKEDVGKFAAEIRNCRPPAPNFKGKGIRWKGEHVRIVSKAGAV